MERLRALSVRQPHAELIMRGKRMIEYRDKPTKMRGLVYIYASSTPGETSDYERLKIKPGALPTGDLIGTVEVIGCRNGDGCYEWLLADPKRLDETMRPLNQPRPDWFYPF